MKSPLECTLATTAAKADAADERVEPIHQAAVAGDEAARILNAETPFDSGFEQVAEFGDNRRREPEPEQRREAVASSERAEGRGRAPANAPTIAPDQVLPGETLGQSRGPPISRPPK